MLKFWIILELEDFIGSIEILLFTLVDNLVIYIKNENLQNFIIEMLKDEFNYMKDHYQAYFL